MLQWRSIRPHFGDYSDYTWNLASAFGAVRCGVESVTLTWVSSFSNQYCLGSISPPEASSRFIRIHIQWPFLKYGQHSLETYQVCYLQNAIIGWELTVGWRSTMSPTIHEWQAITRWDFTTCRLRLTQVIMVWLQLVHLNGCRWD